MALLLPEMYEALYKAPALEALHVLLTSHLAELSTGGAASFQPVVALPDGRSAGIPQPSCVLGNPALARGQSHYTPGPDVGWWPMRLFEQRASFPSLYSS